MRTHVGGRPGRDGANTGRRAGRLRRSLRRDVLRLASGLFVLLGLLAMHGFQATSSPVEMSGVPLPSMAAGHAAPVTGAVTGHRPPQDDRSGDHHSDRHSDHPGGQVCLAMLTLLALVTVLLTLCLRRTPPVAVSRLTRIRILLVGRPPPRPSLHRLSVLRL
ncbi:DUF6153 family protein [Actinomadura citrea]|uniref:Uncharacterized protein n=1 Tax=Actinomadura citrea TaxID=46158 RepID=A0A7Y9G642_9ACTN|nr:DUF6153 family protein [Actinomadura citrea]NYE10648.1 hypothetical protein [Actinomadura citrea]